MDLGRIAYEAYQRSTPGGCDLTPWEEQDTEVRRVWDAVAEAVSQEVWDSMDYNSMIYDRD